MNDIQQNMKQEIERLEEQVCNLENEVVKKRAALRNAQKACNRLEYTHQEVEKLVLVVKAVSDGMGLTDNEGGILDHALQTSLYKMHDVSNFYTVNKGDE